MIIFALRQHRNIIKATRVPQKKLEKRELNFRYMRRETEGDDNLLISLSRAFRSGACVG